VSGRRSSTVDASDETLHRAAAALGGRRAGRRCADSESVQPTPNIWDLLPQCADDHLAVAS
jgi:hypothetical protein